MQDYHRGLALAALHRWERPATAGDVAEHMGALALAEGHPKAYWVAINAQVAAGAIKALEGLRQVERGADVRNARAGRPEPTWQVIGNRNASYPIPHPQDDAPPEPAKPENPYVGMSKPQLYALLGVHDRYAGFFAANLRLFAGFTDELQRLAADARRDLASVGLESKE